ncbi:MAG: PQQ-binding-like beta-propeller repeat protein [Gammaproteobacteria bacterium]|nr:PQQ-binding-like beta-propeller repeat protein [Gammaproteobacteria bacterium]
MERTSLSSIAAVTLTSTLALGGCGSPADTSSAPGTAASTEALAAAPVTDIDGAGIYQQFCASCHEGGVARSPHREFLNLMAGDVILASLTDGVMRQQAAMLSEAQKIAVTDYLALEIPLGAESRYPPPPRCDTDRMAFDFSQPPMQRGWGGVDPFNSRFSPADHAGLTAEEASRLELSWAFALPNANRARSQPSVAGGAVYLGSQDGTVYALEEQTGCLRWSFRASAEVRTAVSITPWEAGDESARPIGFFGDFQARVYAVDLQSGELLWVTRLDDHANATSTGSPVYHDGRVYAPVSSLEVTAAADPDYACCTFRGSVVALDAATGDILWKGYTIPEPPAEFGVTTVGTTIYGPSGAPVWNAPTLDPERGQLYIGTGQNYSSPADGHSNAIIAFDLETGEQRWIFQALAGDAWNMGCYDYYGGDPGPNCPEENGPDLDFGAGTLLSADGSTVLAGQKSGDVWALDPDTGRVKWFHKLGRGGIQGGIHFGMANDGDVLYVPISDMDDGLTYEHPDRPGLFAVDVASGEVRWHYAYEDRCDGKAYCDPGISAAIYAFPGAVAAGAMDGTLRIHARDTGEVLWQFDALREFTTVSGATASGGSFGGPGPVIVNGALYVNSGYGIYYHLPGNVFLRFAPADADRPEEVTAAAQAAGR